MQIIKSLFIGLTLIIPFIKTYASELKDTASFGFDTYSDNNDVQVYSPSFSLMKTVSKNWLIGIKMRVDAIASASIRLGGSPALASPDAQATASKRSGFEDMRYAPTFITSYDDGENKASFGLYYSTEEDYIAKAVFANYTRELNQGNTILGIGFSQSADTWEPANNRKLPQDNRDELKIDLSMTQLLSPTASVQLVYSYMNSKGFLASPYPYMIQNGQFIGLELYPDNRTGHAFAIKGLQYLDDANVMNYSYRYYTDDWDIDSHTLSAEWLHDIDDSWMIGVRMRYYTQTGSFFAKDIGDYTPNDRYVATDYRMTAFDSYDFGIPVKYKPSLESPYTITFSIDYYRTSDNAYIKNWFGEDNTQAIYTTFHVEYEF